jgi:hypothetical protein
MARTLVIERYKRTILPLSQQILTISAFFGARDGLGKTYAQKAAHAILMRIPAARHCVRTKTIEARQPPTRSCNGI